MAGKSLMFGIVGALVVAGAGWVAFGRQAPPAVPVAPVATSLAPSTPVVSSTAVTYAIDPKGKTAISMPAPKEKINAITEAAAGTITVDLANVANTRGEVKIDLTTLST